MNSSQHHTDNDDKQYNIALNRVEIHRIQAEAESQALIAAERRPPIPSASSSAALDAKIKMMNAIIGGMITQAAKKAESKKPPSSNSNSQGHKNNNAPTVRTTFIDLIPPPSLFKKLPISLILSCLLGYLKREELAILIRVNKTWTYIANDPTTILSKHKATEWKAAVENKSHSKIKTLLANGISPLDIKIKVETKKRDGNIVANSLIEILLKDNELGQDIKYFHAADKLLAAGAPLPLPYKTKNEFESTDEYFKHVVNNAYDLYIALRNNAKIVCEQDGNGKTLLHHAASIGLIMGSNSSSIIFGLLFNSPYLDFLIKDNNGNTPLHVCVQHCKDRITCSFVFSNFVREAAKRGFNFSTLNNQGQAVIHLAVRFKYEHHLVPHYAIQKLLNNASILNVDVLSSSGTTALYYAINHLEINQAHWLLDAGANPLVFGNAERDPLAMIEEYLKEITALNVHLKVLIEKYEKENSEKNQLDFARLDNEQAEIVLLGESDQRRDEIAMLLTVDSVRHMVENSDVNIKAAQALNDRMLKIINNINLVPELRKQHAQYLLGNFSIFNIQITNSDKSINDLITDLAVTHDSVLRA